MHEFLQFDDKTFENKARTEQELIEIATVIRRDIIIMLALAKSGHSGGSLDLADFLATLFFDGHIKYDSSNPNLPDRDRFVLSAGHLVPVLYSVLARAGYFPVKELSTLRKYNSRLQGHPGLDTLLPGIETSSGSLGQGISIAVGMAMADKLISKNERDVYCITGDGEIQEGIVWEAAMCASNYKLNNLCWIIDNNDCQIDGRVKDVMNIYPIADKFKAFGFETIEIDGHNIEEIRKSIKFFKDNKLKNQKPSAIILKTIMGKGVSFMEDKYTWHGNPPNFEQAEEALKELI